MAKYRITEDQLQKIFETLEVKKMSEMDNGGYPAGSDTKDAPWNRDMKTKSKKNITDGDFTLVSEISGEYLIMNKKTNELLYTMDEVWETQSGRRWVDIKDALYDFLEIPQSEFDDEDGRGMGPVDDWKEFIDTDEIARALPSYLNYLNSKGLDLGIVDLDRWENGDGHFLTVTPENIDEIYNDNLRSKAKELIGVS